MYEFMMLFLGITSGYMAFMGWFNLVRSRIPQTGVAVATMFTSCFMATVSYFSLAQVF